MKTFEYFTRKITFPFLNMYQLNSLSELLAIFFFLLLQKFKQDLEVKQLATCEELNENYSMEAHSSLARYLINQMCSKGATDSVTLRDDKYGFVESEKKKH